MSLTTLFELSFSLYLLYDFGTLFFHRVMWQKESEVAQSCPTLCNRMDCSLPGSSVHGILQAGILEWVAISFSKGSSWPRDQTWVSRITSRHCTIWATSKAHIYVCNIFLIDFSSYIISLFVAGNVFLFVLKSLLSISIISQFSCCFCLCDILFYILSVYLYLWIYNGTSLIAQLVKNLPAVQETLVWFLGWENLLEKG